MEWKALKNNIESHREISRYRKSYLLRLVRYGEEFSACGQLRAAEMMYTRIEKKLGESRGLFSRFKFKGGLNFEKVSQKWHQQKVEDALGFLQKHSRQLGEEEGKIFRLQIMGAPAPEKKGEPLTPAEKDEAAFLPQIQKERLGALRQAMFERVHRHKRKKISDSLSHKSAAGFPEVVGHYNNKLNVCETLDLLQNLDAGLVEELKGHYRRIEELEKFFP